MSKDAILRNVLDYSKITGLKFWKVGMGLKKD